ncbi:MAG: Asp-tRNA(Asn)/Glu-tRNA(Gln) amidotransferase subunit GatB [Bacteroidia bacterium]|jgi:aspartyl-tRNA(Asn)/glutamyl-tRNA(Gln) amidotransferase subunit B
MIDRYETVVGLEVHIQLSTLSKAYSSDSAAYGAMPNHHVSAVSVGMPGTLPVVNSRVLEYAVRLGLATGSRIRPENHYARKNYFYADLPKGYQITQHTTPICEGGCVEFITDEGEKKQVGLERIHMEEDAGKSMHDQDPFDSLIDLNRAGVPLLEMVSRPDIRSAREAYLYLTEVRRLVRHLDICDGNMEEGSLRCDANISVRLKGEPTLGIKVEVKNMNSMRHVQKAIEYETRRQIERIETGQPIAQETRQFDAMKGVTHSLRSKEDANDYRYFPEPDLPPVFISPEYIQWVQQQLPPLPMALYEKYTGQWGLSPAEAALLVENKSEALYLEELAKHCNQVKNAANWLLVRVKNYLNEQGIGMGEFPLSPSTLGSLIRLVESSKVSYTAAAGPLLEALLISPQSDPEALAAKLNLLQESDRATLEMLADQVIAEMPEELARYREGKTGLLGMFMGKLMKASGGKADPKMASEILKLKLA